MGIKLEESQRIRLYIVLISLAIFRLWIMAIPRPETLADI